MSVAFANRYGVLEVEDEEVEVPQVAAPVKKTDAPKSTAIKEKTKPVESAAADEPVATRQHGSSANRGRGGARGGARGGRGGRSHDHGTRGSPAVEGEAPRQKREFDRRSPPKRNGEKREGHGRGNWGSQKEDAAKPQTEVKEGEESTEVKEGEVPVAAVAEPVDEDAKLKTLSEYRKEATKTTAVLPEARKANEGTDNGQWKNTVVMDRVEEEFYSAKKKEAAKKQKERKVVETIVFEPVSLIEEHEAARRASSFRGGRNGGGRTGRGKKGSDVAPPALGDVDAFPSLKASA